MPARRLLPLVSIVALLVAGCLQPIADPPRVAQQCLDAPCNFLATTEPPTRQANELSIAVNPTDPMNILATGKDYTPDEAGDCVWAGVYASLDGGRTWKQQNVPGSPWRRLKDPSVPVTPFSKFWCATDPVVAFGPDGTAYWTVMPYQCDAASGSKTGRGSAPKGGMNDWFWTCSAMYVLVSTDGGMTWPVEKAREVAFGPRLEHDKQWLTVGRDGALLLCWDRSDDRLWSTGTPLDPTLGEVDKGSAWVECAVSRDKGDTWTRPRRANEDWTGFLPWVDFGPDGAAYMAALDGGSILVSRSPDGLAWGAPVAVAAYKDPPPGGEYGWPVLRGSDFRTFALPSLAVDRSSGPNRGNVYVTWFDHAADEGDVLLSVSRDDGRTWSPPQKVHDDDPTLKADQFMPVVSVGPDGTVDVSWLDRRDDPQNHLFHLYHAYSLDGGRTFSRNQRVSEVAGDERHSHHQNGMVFLGDYRDGDSGDGFTVLTWVDTRQSKADAGVAVVVRPRANG